MLENTIVKLHYSLYDSLLKYMEMNDVNYSCHISLSMEETSVSSL